MSADIGPVESWLEAYRAGDPDEAWDLFLGQYQKLIFATIRHYTRDQDEVMDAFAEVCGALRGDELVRLRKYWERSTHTARFSTWLVTVVRHQVIDWGRQHAFRKCVRYQEREIDGQPSAAAIEDAISFRGDDDDPAVVLDTRLRIASVLSTLKPDERLAVEMFVVHEMPAAAIARALDWPNAKAVYNRVYRALAALRASLKRQGIGREDL